MTVEEVADAMMSSISEISTNKRLNYAQTIREKNVCGKVLSMCELDELKIELDMTFGDWLLFKTWLIMKRNEKNSLMILSLSLSITI